MDNSKCAKNATKSKKSYSGGIVQVAKVGKPVYQYQKRCCVKESECDSKAVMTALKKTHFLQTYNAAGLKKVQSMSLVSGVDCC